MPWRQEQKADEEKEKPHADKKGKKNVKDQGGVQSKLKFGGAKPKTSEKGLSEPLEITKTIKEESKSVNKPDDSMDPSVKLKLLSSVIKTEKVELFEWRYRPTILNKGKPEIGPERELKDLQCILISVNWANHDYLLDTEIELSQPKAQPVKKEKQ